jgi:adenylate cyclase
MVPLGDLPVELDIFEGELEGLRVAEVEFPDEDAAHAFEPPDWFGPEVTDDHRYANESLATHGLPD